VPQAEPEGIVALQVSVAEMKGMLHQALSDQGQRITKLESDMTTVHGRLSDKGKTLATHTEQIGSNRDRIEDLEQAQQGAVSKNTAIIACVLAAGGLILSIAQKVPWGSL
jgi:hypothetical protein